MDSIRKDHISILTLLVEFVKMDKLKVDLIGQLIKRLLVPFLTILGLFQRPFQ